MSTTQKVASGTLNRLIDESHPKFNATEGCIKKTAVDSRIWRGHPERKNVSPLGPVELTFVTVAIMAQRMGWPFTKTGFIACCNKSIEGTPSKAVALEHKRISGNDLEAFTVGNALGICWHKMFMKRHGDKIDRTKDHRKDIDRAPWGTHKNTEITCECICEHLVEKGLAEELEQPVLMDRDGIVVDDPDKACGLPVHHGFTHPNILLHMDEVGCDANMKDDGHANGEAFIVEGTGTRSDLPATSNDIRFTLLPITNFLGEPVCCGCCCLPVQIKCCQATVEIRC